MTNLLTTCVPALLLASTALAQFPYGAGTAGSGGLTPELSCNQPWAGRGSFALEVEQGLGGAPGFVALGLLPHAGSFGGLPLHLDPTAVMTLLPVVLGGSGAGQGATSVSLSLAGVAPNFIGVGFYAQAAFADPQGPGLGGGWTATAGLEVEVTAMPQVFARSVQGATYGFVGLNGLTQAVEFSGNNAFVGGSTMAATYSDDGQDLYVLSSCSSLAHADLRSGTPVWSWLNSAVVSGCNSTDDLHFDRDRALLWGVSQSTLWAVDVDPSRPSYGQIVHSNSTLSAALLGQGVAHWSMDQARKLVAVVGSQAIARPMALVDVDVSSPTFLQVVATTTVAVNAGSVFHIPQDVAFSPDGTECYVLLRDGLSPSIAPNEIARYHVPSGAWIDHDPATPALDNIGATSSPPTSLGGNDRVFFDVGRDGAIWLCGNNGATGASVVTGWVSRLTLTGTTPTVTPLSAVTPPVGASSLVVNRDGTTLAVGLGPYQQMLLFDATTLSETGVVNGPDRVLAFR